MKPYYLLIAALFILSGCSKPTDKFTGYWKPIANSKVTTSGAMWISDFEENYCKMVFYKYEPKDTTSLIYRKDDDALYGHFKSYDRKILYLKDKDHLLATWVTPVEGGFDVELERVPESEINNDNDIKN